MSANIDREYKKVPKDLKDDDVFPSVSEIPSFLTSIRHPGRSRSISIGPQSEADAYETLAYRDKRRRDSLTSAGGTSPKRPSSINCDITVPSSSGKSILFLCRTSTKSCLIISGYERVPHGDCCCARQYICSLERRSDHDAA